MNNMITRWPNGFTNASPGAAFGDLKTPSPTTYFEYFNDFSEYTAADWVVTETDAGATQALAAGANGRLLLQNTAAAIDIVSLQYAGGTGAVRPLFEWNATKDLIVAAQLQVDSQALASFAVGLAVADTTPIASAPANAVYLASGANNLPIARVVSGGVTQEAPVFTNIGVTSAQDFGFCIFYCAQTGTWSYFFQNVGSQSGGAAPSATVFTPPVVGPVALMAPTIAVGNKSAVARSLNIDWIYCAVER